MRLDGEIVDPLLVEGEGPSPDVLATEWQEPIIVPSAATEPKSVGSKAEARHQDPVDPRRGDILAVRGGFSNPSRTSYQLLCGIEDAMEREEIPERIDSREENFLPEIQSPPNHRLRIVLITIRRGEEEKDASRDHPRKALESLDEFGLLPPPILRLDRLDSDPDFPPNRILRALKTVHLTGFARNLGRKSRSP